MVICEKEVTCLHIGLRGFHRDPIFFHALLFYKEAEEFHTEQEYIWGEGVPLMDSSQRLEFIHTSSCLLGTPTPTPKKKIGQSILKWVIKGNNSLYFLPTTLPVCQLNY